MARQRFKAEQIVSKLREVEVLTAKGLTIAEAARQVQVTEQTVYRWRKEYGGMRVDQARRLERFAIRLNRIDRSNFLIGRDFLTVR
jgi:putative transposase